MGKKTRPNVHIIVIPGDEIQTNETKVSNDIIKENSWNKDLYLKIDFTKKQNNNNKKKTHKSHGTPRYAMLLNLKNK